MTTTPVRIANSLRKEFEKLPNKDDWAPVGWPAFVRDAVREKLTQEQHLSKLRDAPPVEDDPSLKK